MYHYNLNIKQIKTKPAYLKGFLTMVGNIFICKKIKMHFNIALMSSDKYPKR